MEIRVKTGSDLVCDYSQEDSYALIKLYDKDGKETSWLGLKALEDALRLLYSMRSQTVQSFQQVVVSNAPMPYETSGYIEPVQQQIMVPPPVISTNHHPQPPPPPPSIFPRIKFPGTNPKDHPEMVKQFEAVIVDLVANPPKSRDNEPDGQVPETAVRELMKRFKSSFKNPNSMFNPIRKHIGMSKERFETLMEGL